MQPTELFPLARRAPGEPGDSGDGDSGSGPATDLGAMGPCWAWPPAAEEEGEGIRAIAPPKVVLATAWPTTACPAVTRSTAGPGRALWSRFSPGGGAG